MNIDDGPSDATTIIKKILTAKLFDDAQGGAWKQSVKDINGEVLCGAYGDVYGTSMSGLDTLRLINVPVSQFTLLAHFKGAKPGEQTILTNAKTELASSTDFHESMVR